MQAKKASFACQDDSQPANSPAKRTVMQFAIGGGGLAIENRVFTRHACDIGIRLAMPPTWISDRRSVAEVIRRTPRSRTTLAEAICLALPEP